MSFLDGILGQASGGTVDMQTLAQRVGLPPEQAEQAVAALARAHQQQGDPIQTAAANTGLPTDKLSAIVQDVGGEGTLRHVASFLGTGAGDASPSNGKVASPAPQAQAGE